MKWQDSIPSGGIDFFAERDSHSGSGRCCVSTNSMRIFLTMRCYEIVVQRREYGLKNT